MSTDKNNRRTILSIVITPLALLSLGILVGLDYKTLATIIISAAIGATYAIGLDRLTQIRES